IGSTARGREATGASQINNGILLAGVRGRTCILALAVVLGSVAPVAPAARAASRCDERSWTGGTTEWCDGAFVYRDYVYDDDGADRVPGWSPHGPSLGEASGDVDHR